MKNTSKNARRNFFKKAGTLSIAALLTPYLNQGSNIPYNLIEEFPKFKNDDLLWKWVQNSYNVSSTISNLNNGSVCPQPKVVQEMFEFINRLFNETPSRHMWSHQAETESVRKKLAEMAGCSSEEIAINRNTTEAMNTVVL